MRDCWGDDCHNPVWGDKVIGTIHQIRGGWISIGLSIESQSDWWIIVYVLSLMCLGRTVSTDASDNDPDCFVEGKSKTVLGEL